MLHRIQLLYIQYDATKSYATKSQCLKRVIVYCLPSSAQWAPEGIYDATLMTHFTGRWYNQVVQKLKYGLIRLVNSIEVKGKYSD